MPIFLVAKAALDSAALPFVAAFVFMGLVSLACKLRLIRFASLGVFSACGTIGLAFVAIKASRPEIVASRAILRYSITECVAFQPHIKT